MIPVYSLTGIQNLGIHGQDDVLKLTNQHNNEYKIFKIRTSGWRLLYYTCERDNAEPSCRSLPYDVQQNIMNYVWNLKYEG